MNFHDCLKAHRSIRKFRKKPVPGNILTELLECGLRAPSAGNMQSWSVVVSQNAEQIEKLHELHFEQDVTRTAPVVLTFCADFSRMRSWLKLCEAKDSFDDLMGFLVGTIDAVIAAQTVAIAAESASLGCCFLGSTLWAFDGISLLLNLPQNVVPVTSLAIGYPDEYPQLAERLPIEAVVHYNKYNEFTEKQLKELFSDKEKAAWDRWLSDPDMAERIKGFQIKAAAEVYTKIKYTKENHARGSKAFLAMLKKKGFGNF